MTRRAFEVDRGDLRRTRVVTDPEAALTPGQVLLRITSLGLTANNVTYGVTGDVLRYWSFFPAQQGWGRIPAWGFATVEESTVVDLPVGTEVFGYLPIASHLVVEPTRVNAERFVDGSAHRASLPSPYNQYRMSATDPMHRPDSAGHQAVLLPLFLTSFVLEDYLDDQSWFAAHQVVLTSASAKTTIGTALLAQHRADRPRLVGLTSSRNVDFVVGLGCYDEVISYDDLDRLEQVPSVLVDVAGDNVVRVGVHDRLGSALAASIAVGLSHWDAEEPSTPASGPRPTFFFAPSQVEKRVGEWGPQEYQRRLAEAWWQTLDLVQPWLRLRQVGGLDEVDRAYQSLLDGKVPPDEALLLVMA